MLPPVVLEHFDDLGYVREGVTITADFDGEAITIVKVALKYIGVKFGGRGATLNLSMADFVAAGIASTITISKSNCG